MTEDQQGGTAPAPEAAASNTDPAPEQNATAVAVADEPAATTEATEQAPGATDTNEAPAPETEAAESGAATPHAATPDAAAPAAPADPAESQAGAAPTAGDDGTDAAADEAAATAATDVDGSAVPTGEAASVTATAVDESEFADAPAASEPDDEPESAPVRELGPEPTTMAELLAEQSEDIKSFKHGDVVEGNVVRIDKDEILVDIGAKSEGVVSNRELYGRHAETQPQLSIGDTVLVYVLQPESPEGHAVLSLRRAGLERKWRSMQEQFEAGLIIEAPVIDHNKGGLIVDCGIRGFVPISQIVDFPRRPQNDQPRDAAQEIAEKLQPFVGRKLRLKILEVNRKANRLILSEKVALYEERREKRDELFSSLQVGQKVTGTVRSIAPFGVFIDLGGIDGLVHKSELSWNKVNNPEAGYKVGEEVEAEVIDINHERGRISLSIRRLQPDPWHSTVADFKTGDIIDGTVTKLVNFGAFVRVRDGLEGLIHISELSHQRVAHPGDVVHEGQTLKLRIISLDSERHRLGLSLKQAEEAPARPAPEPGAPRAERRPRPERAYSPSDAVQEPEGGIDNTLAAAFAQVREQVRAAEAAETDEPTEAPAAASTDAPDAPAADTAETQAEAPEASVAEAPAAEAPAAEAPAAEALSPEPEPEPEPEPAAAADEGASADAPAPEPAVAETADADAPTDAPETEAGTADIDAPEAQLGNPPTDVDVPAAEVLEDPGAPAPTDPDSAAETEPTAPSNERARGEADDDETTQG